MKYVSRQLGSQLRKAAHGFPALIVTGPRRAGKTTLLRHEFPEATYVLLEDPDQIGRAAADPRGFLDELSLPAILDEIQNTPFLFNYIRSLVDAKPDLFGQWLLTGSQEAPLMRGVTESMAGRAAVFQLYPFSLEESNHVAILRGGFPEVLDRPSFSETWFRSYIQTYLERDVRAIASIRDLSTFRRFIALVASRIGSILNKTDIAAPLGVSVPTVSQWLSILEVTGQIILVPPFYENFGKRLIKSPKLYLTDSGLACHLLGIRNQADLSRSPFAGAILEGFVASEILKHRAHRGKDRGLYYFRDRQGLEVDFMVDQGNGRLTLLEVKSTQTPRAGMDIAMTRLSKNIQHYRISKFVVHQGRGNAAASKTLGKSAKAIGLEHLHTIL
jgi:predicted AAA+ superfamily ATPase